MNQTNRNEPVHHPHPLGFSAVVIGTVIAVDAMIKATSELFSAEWSVTTVGIISGAVLSLLGAVVVSRLGLWRPLGLVTPPERWRSLLWFLPFAVYGVLPLTQRAHFTGPTVAGALAFGLLIAFWKLLVLALVTHTWLPRGARPAAAAAAVLWGAMHVGGILFGGAVAPTLLLALSYAFLGFAYVAVRMRTGALWPAVVTYALLLAAAVLVQDSDASNLVADVSDVLPVLLVSVVFAGYGLAAWPRQRSGSSSVRPQSGTKLPPQRQYLPSLRSINPSSTR